MQNNHPYKIYIDVSGTVKGNKDDIFVGCILFNDNYRAAYKEKFYREFPSLQSFNKKGSSLNPDKLKNIINHMDQNKIKMSAVVLPRYIIKRTQNNLKKRIAEIKHLKGEVHLKDFEEKIMGIAYLNAISQLPLRQCQYDCYFCAESQFSIQQALVAFDRLRFIRNMRLRPSFTMRRLEHMIKFADFTASAARKIDKSHINQYQNFKYTTCDLADNDLDIVFGLSRREGSKRNI